MRRPSPALAVACIALFSSLTGGAVAAKLITGKQVKDASLTGRDIKNRSIGRKDLARSARIPGPAGATGPRGPKGEQGIPGPIEGTPAGGVLTGTYPSPGLAEGSVGTAHVRVPTAILRKSAPQFTSSGTSAVLTWDREVVDIGALHDPASSEKFRPPVAGVYEVSASVCWAPSAAGTHRELSILHDQLLQGSAVTDRVNERVPPAGSGPTCVAVTHLFRMEAEDTVRVRTLQDSGSNLAVDGGHPGDGTRASMRWVAPLG